MKTICYIFLLITLTSNSFCQQYVKKSNYIEVNPSVDNATKYVQSKMKKMEHYAKHQQKKLNKTISTLAKKEKRYLRKLKKTDSVAYVQLNEGLNMDSIKSISKEGNTQSTLQKGRNEFSSTLDSLRKIESFAKSKINIGQNVLSKTSIQSTELDKINQLQSKLDYQQSLNELMSKRIQDLKSSTLKNNLLGSFKGMDKQFFYYKQKGNALKEIAKESSILEEKALTLLQGIGGFDEAMTNNGNSMNSNGVDANNVTAEQLEKMGYQTKRQVNKQMSKQFGGNNNSEKLKEINAQVKAQTEKFQTAKKNLQETKNSISKIEKPSFKINPIRGLPLKQRFEKSFTWSTTRPQNTNPAKLEMNIQAGFKHSPRLTYSLVAGGVLGLGRDLRHIQVSNQGIRIGANVDWKAIWGISGQLGFERLYKKYSTQTLQTETGGINPQVITNNKQYRDIAYCGLQKTYKINSKYNGTMLLAYDFLWKQGNATNPIIWRVGWKK